MIVDCPSCSLRHVILDRAGGTMARCECGTEFRLPLSETDASVLKCGNCGANPPPDALTCPWCDAHFATVRCPRCLANSIKGDQHCRACGQALATPVHRLRPDARKSLPCPRCSQPLRATISGDVVLDDCTRCGGIWLEHDVLDDLLAAERDREQLHAALSRLSPPTATQAASTSQSGERFYIPCPECESTMDRRQFAPGSGIVIDVCRPHGIWFDHDELTRIVRFVSEGGMEKAAQKLHERRLAELQRARARQGRPAVIKSEASSPNATFAALEIIGALLATWLR